MEGLGYFRYYMFGPKKSDDRAILPGRQGFYRFPCLATEGLCR